MTKIYECPTLRLSNNGRVGGLMEITEYPDGSAKLVQLQIVPGTNDTQWQRHESTAPALVWPTIKNTIMTGLVRVK